MKQRKIVIMQSSSQKHLYQGEIITDGLSKTTFYDGAGYLFSNENKCFFKGTWNMNEKVCGIETFPNGDVYEGPYLEKKFHGLGLLYNNVRGRYRYEGEFKNGQKDGKGKEEYVSGSTYDGQFRENLKHGQGTLTFSDGSYYTGDFIRGTPSGFGIQFAKFKHRIITVFPLPDSKKEEEDEGEYIYEGDFVDGYKHGIGRLHEPSGSYIYGYWEYNIPVRDIIYYEADGNKWKLINVPSNLERTLDFYEILEKSGWKKTEFNGGGYPTNNLDGFKRLIDEKGLKRERYEDPEFEFTEFQFVINDPATRNHQLAPVDYKRIYDLEVYKLTGYKLFPKGIQTGSLKHQEHFCCQQLTCFLDALTYVPHQLRKIFTRKYEPEMGFYIVKHFKDNEWKEVVMDDYLPVHRDTQLPVFSSSNYELGWNLLFKSVAKRYNSLNYFDDMRKVRIHEYARLLTGLPVYQLKVPKNKELLAKFIKQLTKKFDSTQVRIAYLRTDSANKLQVSQYYAYHVIDTQLIQTNTNDIEYTLVLVKSMLENCTLKTEFNDPKQIDNLTKPQLTAAQKLRDRSPHSKNDNRYFIIPIIDFINNFEDVYLLAGSKYSVMNQLQIKPTPDDQYNNEFRFFCKFQLNVPQRILFMLTQTDPVPVRVILARDKEETSNKQRIKKKIVNQWKDTTEEIRLAKQQELIPTQTQISYLAPELDRKKDRRPFRYIFGRGQSKEINIFKDIQLESGTYTIFIQAEMTKFTPQTQFWIALHGYGLAPIHQVPLIANFQMLVYESAILNAEKNKKQPKFYYKGDLSEQENGSSDLVITQYFLKKEGTYLQHFHNRSNNKIWRQKLYFKLENMMIIDQRDNQKLDLQLSKKETALVIIQQVTGEAYNLEGGEGICIIDLLNDQKEEEEEQDGDQAQGTEPREGDQNNQKPFLEVFDKMKQ